MLPNLLDHQWITCRLLFKALITVILILLLSGCLHQMPELGVRDNRLQPCPETPNCVVSRPDAPESQRVAPFLYNTHQDLAYEQLEALLSERQDAIIVAREHAHYLRADFRTPILGFIDDVEFFFQASGIISVRSASRVGHFDFGVNRRRIEQLRKAFSARLVTPQAERSVKIQTD